MAKKQEFQKDKPSISWVSHFVLTQKQQKALLKWVFYGAILVFLSVMQDVLLSKVRLFGATTELIPCAIFLICIMEGSEKGGTFALAGSALYVFSGTAPGAYCMVLITFLAVFVCIFRQGYLQPSFAATMLCTVFCVIVYELLVFGLGLLLGLTLPSRMIGFAVTAGFSCLAAPVLYPIALFIGSIGGETWKE